MNAWLVFVILVNAICSSLTVGDVVYPCLTPNRQSAYCVSLFSCPHLMKSLSTLDPEAIDYVKKSVCLGCEAGDVMVCCGSPENSTQTTNATSRPPPSLPQTLIVPKVPEELDVAVVTNENDTKEARREYVRTHLLPSQRFCGQQHTDDRVYERNETAIDEFPWIIHLFLADLDEYEFEFGDRCTGVLISDRYVLTDAYCGIETFRVRLGQHSTSKNVSCTEESSIVECAEPVVIRKVEKRARSGKKSNGPYDLTLIRLNQTVTYTDYIRPICLPTAGSKKPTDENYLTFSGFGASSNDAVVKKRITYNLTTLDVCYNASRGLEGNVKFAGVSLACLEPPPGNTLNACNGEHGGPLMYRHRHKWFADAVIIQVLVEGGPSICSTTQPVAGIYLTPTMMDWILDNIED